MKSRNAIIVIVTRKECNYHHKFGRRRVCSQPHMATTTPCILCTKQTDSKNWRPIHSEANRDVFMTLTAMVIEMFGSKSGDTIFPTGRVLCKTCHSSVQSIPKLEKKLLGLNQQIREQLRHAGLPYGLTRLPRQERQSVEAPTCTTPPADSSKGISASVLSSILPV